MGERERKPNKPPQYHDKDGQPTIKALVELKKRAEGIVWGLKEVESLVDFLKLLWSPSGWGVVFRKFPAEGLWGLALCTGGYAPNETIIETLKETGFWRFNWKAYLKGGVYILSNMQGGKVDFEWILNPKINQVNL